MNFPLEEAFFVYSISYAKPNKIILQVFFTLSLCYYCISFTVKFKSSQVPAGKEQKIGAPLEPYRRKGGPNPPMQGQGWKVPLEPGVHWDIPRGTGMTVGWQGWQDSCWLCRASTRGLEKNPCPRQSKGRWGDGVELHWDPSSKTELATQHPTRPFSQASKILRHAYKKRRTPTKQAFRCLYFKLLEWEFKERTIVQREAEVSWIFKRIFSVTSHPRKGH